MNKRTLMKARAIGVLFRKPHTVKVVSKMRKGFAKLVQAQYIDVTIEIPDLPERNELAQNLFGCNAEEAKAKIAEACSLPWEPLPPSFITDQIGALQPRFYFE